ncbi:MAG: sigma-70 family RNA polymerase sigma factor [Archangium sp.]
MIDAAVETRIGAALARRDLELAATEVVGGYGPQIFGFLRGTLPIADADDAFSIWCESLWTQLPAFRGASSVFTWAYRIAIGAAHDARAHKRLVRLSTGAMQALAAEVRSTTARHLKRESSEQLQRLRAQLDHDEQTLLVLRIDRDLAWKDIAEILDEREPALRKRFERLKEKIRTLAEGEGLLEPQRSPRT